jgi:hypothetical protein
VRPIHARGLIAAADDRANESGLAELQFDVVPRALQRAAVRGEARRHSRLGIVKEGEQRSLKLR